MKNIEVIALLLCALVLGAAGGFAYSLLTSQTTEARTPEINMVVATLIGNLKREEGFRGLPYDDTRGDATLGYGTKLPITKAEGAWLLETRLADTHARLAKAWKPYGGLNQARQGALLDLAYEVGVEGLLEFHYMLAALERGDWAAASKAALASVWAKEVPMRAIVIAAALKNG